jgi:hypothetical protein
MNREQKGVEGSYPLMRKIKVKCATLLLAVAGLLFLAPSTARAEILWDMPVAKDPQPYYKGSHGRLDRAEVMRLQRALAERGLYKGKIDGIWGGKTTQALLDYQSINNLPLTGSLSAETLYDFGIGRQPGMCPCP